MSWQDLVGALIPLAFYGGVIVMGVRLVGQLCLVIWIATSCRKWVETDGRILSSSIKMVPLSSAGPGGFMFRPSVTYEYRVDGHRYQGVRFGVASCCHWQSYDQVRDRMRHYPDGGKVAVYHHPRHPNLACLDLTFSRGDVTSEVTGRALLALVMIAFGVQSLRSHFDLY